MSGLDGGGRGPWIINYEYTAAVTNAPRTAPLCINRWSRGAILFAFVFLWRRVRWSVVMVVLQFHLEYMKSMIWLRVASNTKCRHVYCIACSFWCYFSIIKCSLSCFISTIYACRHLPRWSRGSRTSKVGAGGRRHVAAEGSVHERGSGWNGDVDNRVARPNADWERPRIVQSVNMVWRKDRHYSCGVVVDASTLITLLEPGKPHTRWKYAGFHISCYYTHTQQQLYKHHY